MSECDHEWRLATSKQYYAYIWSEPKRSFFMKFRDKVGLKMWRTDEYYCCKCLEEKTKNREKIAKFEKDDKAPKWWSEVVDTEDVTDYVKALS